MTDVAETAHGAKAALRGTFDGALDAIAKYVAPLVGVLAGWMAGSAVGGAQAIGNTIFGATGNGSGLSGASANRIAGLIMSLISAGIGIVFWHLRRGGFWMGLVGGIVGGFFFGVALFNAQFAVTGSQAPAGAIESWSSSARDIAEGQ